MDKKDIYEHLAKIYLDASQKKKKKSKKHQGLRNFFLISLSFAVGFSLFLFTSGQKKKPFNSQYSLLIQSNPAKINFNFNPASKETFSIDLRKLNVARFKELGFSVKKSNFQDSISLRVEFSNAFEEKSEIYIKDISNKWKNYLLKLSDFKKISDWSAISKISFIVEEWNTKSKNGVVLIDNVELMH